MGLASAFGTGLVCTCLAASELCPVHKKHPHAPEENNAPTVMGIAYESRQTAVTTTTTTPPPAQPVIVRPHDEEAMMRVLQTPQSIIRRGSA